MQSFLSPSFARIDAIVDGIVVETIRVDLDDNQAVNMLASKYPGCDIRRIEV